MIKALFLDIDGTLVSFKTHRVPESTITALTEAKRRGVKIFIATGRAHTMINNIPELEERSLIDGYITMNGSFCEVDGAVLYKKPIPKNEALAILDYCTKVGVSCVVVKDDSHWVYQPNATFESIFYDQLHVARNNEISYNDAIKDEIYQLSPFITVEQEAQILADIAGCEIGRWFPAFSDIGAKGNTKSKGIAKVIEHFGIELSEVMAIGDGGNDKTMLAYAGVGVAMGNAKDEVKAVADYVTTSVDQDGIANALKHFSVI